MHPTLNGELIFSYGTQVTGSAVSLWTPGAGFQLLNAQNYNSGWDSSNFAQFMVQGTAAAITPTVGGSSGTMQTVSVALKPAVAGTAPAAGIRVVNMQGYNVYGSNVRVGASGSGPWGPFQFPTRGNLLHISNTWYPTTAPGNGFTGITDTAGNSYGYPSQVVSTDTQAGSTQIAYAQNATASLSNAITFGNDALNPNGHLHLELYDVVGAAAAAFDKVTSANGVQTSGSGTLTTATLVPAGANELVINVTTIDSNNLSDVVGAGYISDIADSPSFDGAGSGLETDCGFAHIYTGASTTFVYTIQNGTFVNGWASQSGSYKTTAGPPPLQITTTSPLPSATIGVIYSDTMTGTGGVPAYTWSATGAPPGLSLSASGAWSGTPTTANTYSPTVTLKDSVPNTTTGTFTLTVNPVSSGSSLSSFVASMSAGTWSARQDQGGFTMTGMNNALIAGGGTDGIFEYCANACWDPTHNKIQFVGEAHGTTYFTNWITYTDSSNTWSQGTPPYQGSAANPSHPYYQNALDPVTGDAYNRQYESSTIYALPYGGSWQTVSATDPQGVHAQIEYQGWNPKVNSGAGGLVCVSSNAATGGASVTLYTHPSGNALGGSWSTLSSTSPASFTGNYYYSGFYDYATGNTYAAFSGSTTQLQVVAPNGTVSTVSSASRALSECWVRTITQHRA